MLWYCGSYVSGGDGDLGLKDSW